MTSKHREDLQWKSYLEPHRTFLSWTEHPPSSSYLCTLGVSSVCTVPLIDRLNTLRSDGYSVTVKLLSLVYRCGPGDGHVYPVFLHCAHFHPYPTVVKESGFVILTMSRLDNNALTTSWRPPEGEEGGSYTTDSSVVIVYLCGRTRTSVTSHRSRRRPDMCTSSTFTGPGYRDRRYLFVHRVGPGKWRALPVER